MYLIPNGFRDRAISLHNTVHCADEQHAMSSHKLQSALMLTVEFSKLYYIVLGKLHQLCPFNSEHWY
jgi:hypothetical protein